MDTENNGGILQFLEDNPTLSIGGAIVVVLLVGAFLFRRQAASSPTASAAQDLSGLATDANGNHVVYVPTQTSFTTVNKSESSNSGNTTTTTNNNPPPPQLSYGILGGGVTNLDAHDVTHITYVQNGQKKVYTGFPKGTQITGGAERRHWYILPGENMVRLLTSGVGPGVTNDPHPLGATGSGGRSAPVPHPAMPSMKWTRRYTLMPGDSLAGIAQNVSFQARRAGAPQTTLVTAQMIQRYNNIVGPVYPGRSIILPQWG